MDRDEFMELVYETFADEPDNVLANGIIEAADAYAEHEKAQLLKEGTTKDAISKTETVEHLRRMLESTVPNTDYDEGYIDGIEFGISTVSTMPTIQPVATDTNVGDKTSRQAAIDEIHCDITVTGKQNAELVASTIGAFIDRIKALPSAQPEEAIPVSWIEAKIAKFMMAGDAFSGLTASIIRVMLNEWKREQEGATT